MQNIGLYSGQCCEFPLHSVFMYILVVGFNLLIYIIHSFSIRNTLICINIVYMHLIYAHFYWRMYSYIKRE